MPEPSRVRSQLGSELRSLRRLAGRTQQDMDPGRRQHRVSRVESGLTLLTAVELRRWLDTTDAPDEVRERVLALAEIAHGEIRPWNTLTEAPHLQGVAAEREEAAGLIRNCAISWLPGLCQTAEYARHLIPQADPYGSIDHAAAVAARMQRQGLLYREGRRFEFLISEHAVRWAPGPGVMAAQRDRLVQVSTLAAVELRVLADARIGAPDWGNFILFTPEGGGDVSVTTEYPHGGADNPDPQVTALYEAAWSRLWDAALRRDEAIAAIRNL